MIKNFQTVSGSGKLRACLFHSHCDDDKILIGGALSMTHSGSLDTPGYNGAKVP